MGIDGGIIPSLPEAMETRLRRIQEACAGRSDDIGTSGLTPTLATSEAFIRQFNQWINVVHKVFGQGAVKERPCIY